MWSQSIDIFNPYKATIESIIKDEEATSSASSDK